MGEGGYVAEFVTDVFAPLLKEIVDKKIKVVTNAGGPHPVLVDLSSLAHLVDIVFVGMNPEALKKHLEAIAAKAGVSLTVAAVSGDDLMESFSTLSEQGAVKSFDIEGVAEVLPKRPMLSSNAYFGAFPVAMALQAGAQVVVTGRAVDSAIVLGPLIAEFGWSESSYDLLGAGSICGHILECGCHTTGGNFTDWRLSLANGWHNVGYPIAECFADGSFIVTKPPNTGGLVSVATVAEQIVYEIHDPANYFLPDVIADFTQVKLEELPPLNGYHLPPRLTAIVLLIIYMHIFSAGRVRVTGGRGRSPTAWYKVSNTYLGQFKMTAMLMVGGPEARAKALAVGEAIV